MKSTGVESISRGKPSLALICLRFHPNHQQAMPSNTILRPEQSLLTTTPRILSSSPGTIARSRTYLLDPNLSSAATGSTSNDAAKVIIGTLVLRNARLEAEIGRLTEEKGQMIRDREAAGTKAEEQAAKDETMVSHELKEAHMLIDSLELKTRKFEAEREKLLRDREAKGAEAGEKSAKLLKEKEETVERYRHLKGQARNANATMEHLRADLGMAQNQVTYLEALLALEERSGYSSLLGELLLEVHIYIHTHIYIYTHIYTHIYLYIHISTHTHILYFIKMSSFLV